MYTKAYSSCLVGIEGKLIEVEVNVHPGLPSFILIGLPSSSVRESAERVRTGIQNSGFDYPMRRITVNLAPSELRKEGSSLDLAMAVCLLVGTNQITFERLDRTLFIGEIALDGTVRAIAGVLSMVEAAKRHGFQQVVVPMENVNEAILIEGIDVIGIHALIDLRDTLIPINRSTIERDHLIWPIKSQGDMQGDYANCIGQSQAIRAITIAVAGNHNILFNGPPGSGKTMMMRLMPTILPSLALEEAIEITKIYSIAEQYPGGLIGNRPFRSPHHTISIAGLIGGGLKLKPGELSMAHHGVLFLDEFTEFPKHVLETLRQPLEQHHIVLSRAKQTLVYPSQVLLAAAMNPCPCGYKDYLNVSKTCICSPAAITRYRSKLSGPLLDRMDLVVSVPEVNLSTFKRIKPNPSSASLKNQIEAAIRFRTERLGINGEQSKEVEHFIQGAFHTLGISMRARNSILKVARTIADLEQSERIETWHLSEAIGYRNTLLHKTVA